MRTVARRDQWEGSGVVMRAYGVASGAAGAGKARAWGSHRLVGFGDVLMVRFLSTTWVHLSQEETSTQYLDTYGVIN